jgi:multiple sugar transport system permease protein
MTAVLDRQRGTDGAAVPRRPARRRRGRGRRLTILAFMAPWLVGLTLFFVYPALATLFYSFTNFDLIDNPTFAGLKNYVFMFTSDPLLWTSIGNTVWLTVALTVGRVAFGLLCAVILVRIKRGAGVFRTLFYIPALAPPVAASLAFVFLLNPATGPVNQFLRLLGIHGPLWFTDPAWAKPSLATLGLWTSGTIIVIFLAALLDVPGELYEAASLDGANAWQQFRSITVPAIAPVITFAVVNSIIVGLQYFTEAVVAGAVASGSSYTSGSSNNIGYPSNSTLTFPMWLYEQAFHQFHMGYASAMAIVLFIVSAVFTVVLVNQMRSAGIGEEEE